MGALEILDEVTSAGYTAVRLVQMATEQHNLMLDAARELQEQLLSNGIKISVSTPRFDQPGEILLNQAQFNGIRRGIRKIICHATIASNAPRHRRVRCGMRSRKTDRIPNRSCSRAWRKNAQVNSARLGQSWEGS